jgi:hypothetical protein
LHVAKSDYAINGGDTIVNTGTGPLSTDPEDIRNHEWPDITQYNGVSFLGSEVNMNQITDGLSNTYLVGEKYVIPGDQQADLGDDQLMYVGDDADIRRWGVAPPLSDTAGEINRFVWGSMHPSVCPFVLCDGSIRRIAYTIDPVTHARLSNRRDGQPVEIQ